MNDLAKIVEALIFAADSPLPLKTMQTLVAEASKEEIEAALDELKDAYAEHALMLKKVGGGYEFATKPDYAKYVAQMFDTTASSRLSRAALETLAIVAFKQPISKVEISAIRGVNSDGVVKKLLDRKLVTISGRDEGPGRALLFKTTPAFLQYFGINDISDLPKPKEVEELLAEGEGGRLLRELPDDAVLEEIDADAENDTQAETPKSEKETGKADPSEPGNNTGEAQTSEPDKETDEADPPETENDKPKGASE